MTTLGHQWISSGRRPWSLRVKSDSCAKCGLSPDAHVGSQGGTHEDLLDAVEEALARQSNADLAEDLLDAVEEAIRQRALPLTVQNRLTAAYNAVIKEAN